MSEIIFPSAFAKRMQEQLGENWEKFCNAHLQPSPTSIRGNPKKRPQISQIGTDDSILPEKIAWTDFGYYLNKRPSFTFDPLFHAGTYYVQEASSMFLEQALKQTVDLSQPLRVLDLCAAPGGKSTHLLSLISSDSLLITNETIRTRATILAENICKWGNLNVIVTNNDPEDFEQLNGFFDVIVIDAPCSGEGLFRKDKDAIYEWSEENAALCSSRQQRIINQIWPALKQNGVLIYSTCTYNKKENEENLTSFIASGKAESLKLKTESEWGIEEMETQGVYGYQCYPNKVKGEGFFLSALRKLESEQEINPRTKKLFEFSPKKIVQQLSSWVKTADRIEFISQDELILGLPKENTAEIEFLSKKLKVIQKGTAIATVKHDKLIPEHAFALSHEINTVNFPSVELTLEQAIIYLRKDVLNLSSEKTGFTLMKYQSTPIGWMNQLGNRSNNLYPSHWRILSSHNKSE